MKKYMMMILALLTVCALAIGAAVAEPTDGTTSATTAAPEQSEQAEEKAPVPTDATSSATSEHARNGKAAPEENSALQDAMEAYRKAKTQEGLADFEAELKAMVEKGLLTQEQADLLLKEMQEGNLTFGSCQYGCGGCMYMQGGMGRGGYGDYGRGGMKGGKGFNGRG